jgi:hypothetical protein
LLTFCSQVIIECKKDDDYEGFIMLLLSYAEECAGHGQPIAERGKGSGAALTSVRLGLDSKARAVMQDGGLRNATSELRALLERFANGQSMNMIFTAANAFD